MFPQHFEGGSRMKMSMLVLCMGIALLLCNKGMAQDEAKKDAGKDPKKRATSTVSFKKDVMPIINKHCMPCHAEDNFNPSELSFDSYKLLKGGGKNGAAFVAGKSGESLLVEKMMEDPPFGDRMPLNSKKAIKDGKAKYLGEDEVKTIATWIDQGAKDN